MTHTRAQKDADKAAAHWLISEGDFRKAVEPYTLEFVAALTKGDPDEPLEAHAKKLKALADLYADPKRKVVSYWTMGFNQHTRGTWLNEQAYMIHLLTGKQAKPGCGAFSLTGQPSACGTAREVGTFSHRLPADMTVDNAEHRATRRRTGSSREDDQPEGREPHHRDDAGPRGRQAEVALDPGDEPVPVHREQRPLARGRATARHVPRHLGRVPGHQRESVRPDPAERDDLREVGRLRELRAPHAALAAAGARAGRREDRPLADP